MITFSRLWGEFEIITSAAVTWLRTMVCSCADDAFRVLSVVPVFVAFPLVTNLKVARAMLDFQRQTVFHAILCWSLLSSKQSVIKQLLDSVFVIS